MTRGFIDLLPLTVHSPAAAVKSFSGWRELDMPFVVARVRFAVPAAVERAGYEEEIEAARAAARSVASVRRGRSACIVVHC